MSARDPSERLTRLSALRRFAITITVFNVLGHTIFGFEQSWAQPLVAVGTAYLIEILLELSDAWGNRRPLRFGNGPRDYVDFLLSAHITGLAISMLTYANDRLLPVMFATAVAVGSKAIFRVPVGTSSRHIFNPSNFGIAVLLLLFPWVGIAPPYHFTENLDPVFHWVLPGLIVLSGSYLNVRLTHRLPLILAWLGGFAAQGLARSLLFGTPVAAAWLPMTGLAFVLYTFYMVTDPATTPTRARGQAAFGLAVAMMYGLLVVAHVAFGLFFALTMVSLVRGLGLYARRLVGEWPVRKTARPAPATGRLQEAKL
jgi:Na+-translocating ferredoxin:NAD+ oxidoreductase RnfD subunit